MQRLPSLLAALSLSAMAAAPVLAHHSFAMFDQTRRVTIEGTISEIQWTNPHVWIHVDVVQEDGSIVVWPMELTSVVHLTRRGFPRDEVNVGDSGTFTMSPYHSGEPGGRFDRLELTNGVTYPSRP